MIRLSQGGLLNHRPLGPAFLSNKSPMGLKMCLFKFPGAAAGDGAGPRTTLGGAQTATALSQGGAWLFACTRLPEVQCLEHLG